MRNCSTCSLHQADEGRWTNDDDGERPIFSRPAIPSRATVNHDAMLIAFHPYRNSKPSSPRSYPPSPSSPFTSQSIMSCVYRTVAWHGTVCAHHHSHPRTKQAPSTMHLGRGTYPHRSSPFYTLLELNPKTPNSRPHPASNRTVL